MSLETLDFSLKWTIQRGETGHSLKLTVASLKVNFDFGPSNFIQKGYPVFFVHFRRPSTFADRSNYPWSPIFSRLQSKTLDRPH